MRERQTVEGTVQHIVFQNEENGYTILTLTTDQGELITVVGCIPFAAPGEGMTVTGVWNEHPTYGRQLSAESVERRMPEETDPICLPASSRAWAPPPPCVWRSASARTPCG